VDVETDDTELVGPRNLDRMTTIYGPTTWDVYARLDESLDPRGPDMLHELAASLLPADGGVILDAGCRDAAHLIRLVLAHPGTTGIGVEPVEIHVERANAAVLAAGLADRIRIHRGIIHDVPDTAPGTVDLVWCRDVLEQVDDVDGALAGLRAVMKPGAPLLVYTVFANDRLDGADLAMMQRHLGWVDGALDRDRMEAAFARAGFTVELVDEIGTEWREHAEEHAPSVSRSLLHLARLRRQENQIVEWRGQEIYDHIEANLHWETFVLLGKLEPVVYVLRRR
jgi:cyclopropane fatty-acyl-phospholipid synthase-like methyltransferase